MGGGFLDHAALSVDGTTLINLEVLAWMGGVVLPVLLAGVFVEVLQRGRLRSNSQAWVAGFVIVSLLVVPQLILYRSYGGFTIDRYALPAGLGVAGGVAAAGAWSRRLGQRSVFVAVTTLGDHG
jgi:hypothetical protein